MNRQIFGKTGELLAERYLKEKGYKIITANYFAARGELDLVALRRGVLVFAEVKAKAGTQKGVPASQLTEAKKAAIHRAAMHFIKAVGSGGRVRTNLFGISIYRKYRNIRFDLLELLVENGRARRVIHTKNVIKTGS